MMNSSDIRLTDSMERDLLQRAIEAEQNYALDRAVKNFFRKAFSWMRAPHDVNPRVTSPAPVANAH